MNGQKTRIPIGLCIYGIAYTAGYVGAGTARVNPNPLTSHSFLDLAAQHGLTSVEMDFGFVSRQEDERTLFAFRDRAQELGLQIVSAGPKIDAAAFAQHLPLAAKMGAKVVRCVISGILCGDRRPLGGLAGWRRHLVATAEQLKKISQLAEELGIRIGVENHQDATTEDLLWLCNEVGSANVGITLDAGNPLAVAEDPVECAQSILPYLVHVHLKDYRMVRTSSGYRLFHCPIGAGVVNFAALFQLFASKPGLLCHIEMAALSERHIRFLDDDYWAGHNPRQMKSMLPVLRHWRDCETDVEWRTPWETGDEATLVEWEMQRLEESVGNVRRLVG